MNNKTGKIKLGSFCYFIGGSGFPISLQGKSAGDYPFYKVSDMNLQGNERYLSKANNYVCLYDVDKYNWKTIPQGAVCFAKVGAALLLNRRRIATSNCLIDNNMMAAVPKEPSMSVFLYWLFQTIDFEDFV
ncbi:MAG: hypothetical protein PHH11_15890 [Methylomonas sp.]|nr:hypothetical protein [Methylomonas sp.]